MIKHYWYVLGLAVLVLSLFLFNPGDKETNASKDFSLELTEPIDETETVDDSSEDEKNSEEANKVIVDVKGEVHYPGVYEVAKDVRVNDVIEVAGGLTDEANANAINLAERVTDEMIVIVPSFEEENVDFSFTEVDSDKVKVNDATSAELETLPGIGPKKAEAILNYIEEHGAFSDENDLLNVPGIGEATLANIRESIQVP